ATPPANSGGGNNGDNIHAQTPEFGTPGQQPPNIPGNPTDPPAAQQAPNQQPGGQQGQQRGQQNSGTEQQRQQQEPTVTTTPTRSAPQRTPEVRSTETSTSRTNDDSDRSQSDNEDDENSGIPYAIAETAALAGTRRRKDASMTTAAVADRATDTVTREVANNLTYFATEPGQSQQGLPGQYIGSPLNSKTPTLSGSGSTNRMFEQTEVPPGFYDPDMSSSIAKPFNRTVTIDPDLVPDAKGAWSKNILVKGPNPFGAGDSGKSQVSIPVRPDSSGKAGSADVQIAKQVQIRIASITPVSASAYNYNGKNVLSVSYVYNYEARSQFSGGLNGTQILPQPSGWAPISAANVSDLRAQGVPVPQLGL
ncbi:hypothetical protein, partial [Tsukamurella strandjordii]